MCRGVSLPQGLHGRVQGQDAHGGGRPALRRHPPPPAGASTEPHHLGRVAAPLAHGFTPQPGRERLHIPHDRHQPTGRPPRDDLTAPRAMLPQPGQPAPCDLAPADLPSRRAGMGSPWPHHASGPQPRRQGRRRDPQRLGRRAVPPGGVPLLLERGPGLGASRVPPTPPRARAHHAATVPAPPPRRRGQRHTDRARTAPALALPASPLRRRAPPSASATGATGGLSHP